MWPLMIALRAYVPYITFPVAAAIGFIGYHVEGWVSDRSTPANTKSIEEAREDRQLAKLMQGGDSTQVDSLKEKKFVPKTILDKNLSPSLRGPPHQQ